MNLKEWAEGQGVAYVTARRWFAAGKLPVPAYRVGGLILIGDPAAPDVAERERLRRLLAECLDTGTLSAGLVTRVSAELGR